MQSGTPIRLIIDEVRMQLSDDADMYTDSFILSAINSAIHMLAMEEDCQRLFKCRYQAELATLNRDGKPAARWTLDIPGEVVGKERFACVDMECYKDCTPCYRTPKEFYSTYRFPEQNCAGLPSTYTLENYNGKTTVIFDRPLDRLCALDAMFYIVPEYIPKSALDDPNYRINVSPSYMEAICELVKVIINEEETDFSTANARLQDYDKLVVDIANKLALQEMNDEPVFIRGFADTALYGERIYG